MSSERKPSMKYEIEGGKLLKYLPEDNENEITLPEDIVLPEKYWHYERSSEKMASILLHIMAENNGMKAIYQNHAGCERGYFITKDNKFIALPKKDKNNINLYIPDLVLYSSRYNEILLIEGKKLSTIKGGLKKLKIMNNIENEYIKVVYPECEIYRYLSIFGGNLQKIPHEKVLFYLTNEGNIYINNNAPSLIKNSDFAEVIHA